MNVLIETVASNCLVATALAVVVAIIAKCRVNPSLVHFLLLLVLVKLFTPPLIAVGIPWPSMLQARDPVETVVVGTEAVIPADMTAGPQRSQSPAVMSPVVNWQTLVMAIWAAGVIVIFGTTLFRIVTFRRLLRHAEEASEFLALTTKRLCRKMGVRNVPQILILPVRITPAVWSLTGRPRIILPQELVDEMSRERLETIIAHELAHIRRKDHLVRFLEFAGTTVFWWNPVVWWVRRHLRELEERCCDAIVLETVPNSARDYAIALVETLEFLSDDRGRLPIGATAAKPTVSLSRRIEMLKSGMNSRRLTARGMAATVCLLAAPMALTLADAPPSSSTLTTKVYDLGFLKSEVKQVERQFLREIGSKQWKRNGGPFEIRRTANGNLVVKATSAVHEQIALTLDVRELARLLRQATKKLNRLRGLPIPHKKKSFHLDKGNWKKLRILGIETNENKAGILGIETNEKKASGLFLLRIHGLVGPDEKKTKGLLFRLDGTDEKKSKGLLFRLDGLDETIKVTGQRGTRYSTSKRNHRKPDALIRVRKFK